MLLFSLEHGGLLAIIPDGIIQHLRVGASSALAAAAMARPEARTLGLIGAGGQAQAQLLGLAEVRDLSSVRVYSPRPERRGAFAAEMRERLGVSVEAVDSARAAVEGADLVATATNAARPVLDAEWLSPGQHVGYIRDTR